MTEKSSIKTSTKKVTIDESTEDGVEGPISYAWHSKGSDRVVLGVAVVDFNHLVSAFR